jgi:xanthine dehydrogenase accessory factor
MGNWLTDARAALAQGPTALVTILATEGSAPRGPGARMVVTGERLLGTIGGGALEHQAAEQARAILSHPPGSWRVQDYPLGPLLGQCCGGRVRLMVERLERAPETAGPFRVTLGGKVVREAISDDAGILSARGPLPIEGARFIEPVEANSLRVYLFGAGHVGRAIAAHAQRLPIHLAWFDARAAEAETPGVMLADEDAMVACAGDAPEGSAVAILTHDHALDYRLTAAALGSRAGYVGLIGSQTKRARFISRLEKDGVDPSRLICPIGIPGIPGKEPEVIAIATLAQLLSLRSAA